MQFQWFHCVADKSAAGGQVVVSRRGRPQVVQPSDLHIRLEHGQKGHNQTGRQRGQQGTGDSGIEQGPHTASLDPG